MCRMWEAGSRRNVESPWQGPFGVSVIDCIKDKSNRKHAQAVRARTPTGTVPKATGRPSKWRRTIQRLDTIGDGY